MSILIYNIKQKSNQQIPASCLSSQCVQLWTIWWDSRILFVDWKSWLDYLVWNKQNWLLCFTCCCLFYFTAPSFLLLTIDWKRKKKKNYFFFWLLSEPITRRLQSTRWKLESFRQGLYEEEKPFFQLIVKCDWLLTADIPVDW